MRLIKESGYAVVADDVFDKLFRLIDTVGGGGNDDVLILSNDVRDVGIRCSGQCGSVHDPQLEIGHIHFVCLITENFVIQPVAVEHHGRITVDKILLCEVIALARASFHVIFLFHQSVPVIRCSFQLRVGIVEGRPVGALGRKRGSVLVFKKFFDSVFSRQLCPPGIYGVVEIVGVLSRKDERLYGGAQIAAFDGERGAVYRGAERGQLVISGRYLPPVCLEHFFVVKNPARARRPGETVTGFRIFLIGVPDTIGVFVAYLIADFNAVHRIVKQVVEGRKLFLRGIRLPGRIRGNVKIVVIFLRRHV